MLRDEGYTKYVCHHSPGSLPHADYAPLLSLRNRLRAAHLIGRYPDGIGYGNVSQRMPVGLVITATQTGHLPTIDTQQLSHVYACQVQENQLWCRGPLPASSEAMTHDSIYQALPQVQVVAHIHQAAFWQQYLHELPTTPVDVPYGTPDMAQAVAKLLARQATGIFLMAGHEEGIFAYGNSYADLLAILVSHFPDL